MVIKTQLARKLSQSQSIVLPFNLKIVLSLFQKSTCTRFQPIIVNAQYIDDALFYSPNEESHYVLPKQFAYLIKHYGIVSSKKKDVDNRQEKHLGKN